MKNERYCYVCRNSLASYTDTKLYFRLVCDVCVAKLIAPTVLVKMKIRLLRKFPHLLKEIKDYG